MQLANLEVGHSYYLDATAADGSGGYGTVFGPVLGAVGYQRLRGLLLTSDLFKNIQLSVAGVLLLGIILFIPAGAVGWLRRRFPVTRRYVP